MCLNINFVMFKVYGTYDVANDEVLFTALNIYISSCMYIETSWQYYPLNISFLFIYFTYASEDLY